MFRNDVQKPHFHPPYLIFIQKPTYFPNLLTFLIYFLENR